jgi:hypothetical protein
VNQTTPKQIASSHPFFPVAARPDLPPRNVPDKKEVSKSESDIHNSFPFDGDCGCLTLSEGDPGDDG